MKPLILVLVLILLTYNVKGFAVSSPYWEENPLVMEPGDSKTVTFTLQNMVGSEDLVAYVEILGGNEIAKVIDKIKEYDVPLGKDDVKVNLQVTIPNGATIGSKYKIDINFVTNTKTEQSGVKLNTGVRKIVDVYVQDLPEKPITQQTTETQTSNRFMVNNMVLIALLILIAIVIFLYTFSRKRKS